MKPSSNPKISVVMAVYNGLPYLKEAVRSILRQTFSDFEFIIVDDASTDSSWKHLKSIKDKRVKLIRNKKNLGLAASLNTGLKIARGKYIARMDADDISLPQRLATQLKFMQKNPTVDICGTWTKLIDENDNIIGKVHKAAKDKDIKKMNRYITGVVHPTWLVKKKVFEKLKGYNSRFDMVEDFDFLLRAEKFKMANIEKELLLWRSTTNRRSQKDIQEMYRKSFSVKWLYFKKGQLGLAFTPILIRSFIATYLFPVQLKIYLNKRAGTL